MENLLTILNNKSLLMALAAIGSTALAYTMLNFEYGLLSFAGLSGTATIDRGHKLYNERCSSCHGLHLEGQPNWKNPLPSGRLPAPPHDQSGHTWHHDDIALIDIIKLGLRPFVGETYESDMPAFGTTLRDEEIIAIISYIESTWPDRERMYQQQITRQTNSK